MFSRFKQRTLAIIAILGGLTLPQAAASDTYVVDTVHSSIIFKIQHNRVGQFMGRFNQFEGTIQYNEADPGATQVELKVNAESVDTANERRDKHLRSPDFFNAKQFGEVTFKSTKTEKKGDKLHVTGDLVMLGKSKSVTVEVEDLGSFDHPRGGTLRGFLAMTTIKRSDFDMTFGLDNGALGDDVHLVFSFETKAQ